MRSGLLTAVIALAALASCSKRSGEGVPPIPDGGAADTRGAADTDPDGADADSGAGGFTFGPRAIEGRWFAGDFHVHATGASNDTGQQSTPERIKDVAVDRGMDFVVLTDHSNSTGSDTTTQEEDPALFNLGPEFPYWERAAELSDATFLMVDGNEISPVDEPTVDPTGHIGCYPRSLTDFDPSIAFVDRPRGSVPGRDAIAQARDAGCFVTVNHPFVASFWMAFDWTTRDYDALEVFNGGAGWDRFDYLAVQGWACDLSQGRSVTAVGGSDNHRVEVEPPGNLGNPALGWPITWVWAETLDWDQLVASLDEGRVAITDTGSPLELDVYRTTGEWVGFAGTRLSAAEPAILRLRGALAHSDGEPRQVQIVRVRAGSCDDRREEFELTAPEIAFELLFEQEVLPDTTFDVHTEAQLQPGDLVFGWLHPGGSEVIGLHGAGLTNAVRFE